MGMGMPINQQHMMYNAPSGFMPMMPGFYMPMPMMPPNPHGMMPMNQSDPNLMPGSYNPYSMGAQQQQQQHNTLQRNYSQQQFNTIDNRRDDHFISLKNKKNVHFSQSAQKNQLPHQRNFSMQPGHGRDYDDDIEHQMYTKPQRKFWSFEDFKEQTLPRLQLRKIIKIQALIRGAYVRKRRWPKLILWHQGAVRYTDSLIDHYIEDIFIPDLVLEILTKNRVYENIDLYSDENKILYQIRQEMMEKVVRQMAKETVKQAQDQIVNEYLNKRFRSKTIDEQDPMRRVVTEMMDNVMKSIAKDIAKTQTQGLVFDYLIEAQFIGFFNNYYIRREVEHTVKDAIEDLAVGEVIEDLVDRIVLEAVPIIAQGELNSEIKRQDKQEINYAFGEYIDRCMLEIIIENLAKLYEDEDREINLREQTDKSRRDEIRSKSQAAKIEDDEFERMSQMNKSMRSQRAMSQASRRSFNSMAGGGSGYNMGNPNVRDRYQANYPGGDPDFDRMDPLSGAQTPAVVVQPVVEEKKEEEPKKKSGGLFGFFKR